MKRNRLKEIIALAVCACTLAGTAATAQESSSAYTVGSLEAYDGSFVVNRFGLRDGRLVAYGRLVPSDMSSSSSFDASALGNWTGIGTGYGESGRESRSTMVSDNDGPVSMSLVRPSDDVRGLDVRFGPTSGNDRVATGIDVRMGPTSGNDRTTIDASMGATSANDRTTIDAKMGATSANDRSAIDLKFGPTSGNDRVASPDAIDLKFGPTSANDRTRIDADFGATSGNDRTTIDAELGATSANDRTTLDASMGATSGNDRVASGIDVQMGATSGNDRTALSASSSSEVVVPVTIVSASCDAVSLSFAGSESVVVSASPRSSDDVRSTLCAVADARESALVSTHLNRLIGE